MTTIEKAAMTIEPGANHTIWELGLVKHKELSVQMHGGNPMFGYAHRMFLRWFEEKLQQINPKFAFFYWDSGNEFSTWSKSKIWNYLGSQQGKVQIKGFNGTVFSSLNNSQLQRQCITSKNPPPSEYYVELWEKSKDKGYSDYSKQLEYAHGVMHNLVGGTGGQMSRLETAPLDPIFYPHHAYVDYTLLKAQLLWAEGNYPLEKSYGPNLTLTTKLPGFPDKDIGDVLDVADICVSYVPSAGKEDPASTPVNATNTTMNNTLNTTSNTTSNTTTNTTKNTTTNTTVNITANTTLGSNVMNSTQNLKNFTLELSEDWLKTSFKNNSQEVKNQAEGIRESLKGKVDRGETIVTNTASGDESRAYVGVKAQAQGLLDNLKRLKENGVSTLHGASSTQLVFSAFLVFIYFEIHSV